MWPTQDRQVFAFAFHLFDFGSTFFFLDFHGLCVYEYLLGQQWWLVAPFLQQLHTIELSKAETCSTMILVLSYVLFVCTIKKFLMAKRYSVWMVIIFRVPVSKTLIIIFFYQVWELMCFIEMVYLSLPHLLHLKMK